MKIHIYEILDKANPNKGNIIGFNLVAVKHMTDQVTKNVVVTRATFNRA
jgi:hypothetical protein